MTATATPRTVVIDGWSFSTTFPHDHDAPIPAYRVSAVRYLNATGPDRIEHPLHGTVYPTQAEATQAGLDAGILAPWASTPCVVEGCRSSEHARTDLPRTGRCHAHRVVS